jgi:Zn-dependent M28 family amino/carboxypeptidase
MRWSRVAVLLALALVFIVSGLTCVTTQPLVIAQRFGPEVHVDATKLEASVRKLAIDLHPHGYKDVENLDRVVAWLKSELGDRALEQTWDVQGHTYRNVSITYGPTTGERIVVGAHYDTCEGLPGADDNSSGVAGVLELAHLFADKPPPFPVELVFWSLEEPPWFRTSKMGSAQHAASAAHVKAVLSIEAIGYFSDAPGSQHFPIDALGLIYPTTANHIAIVGDFGQIALVRTVKGAMQGASQLPVSSINATSIIPGIDWSDHLNYWAKGIPAVMITDTALNRNANYHQPSDTPDTLDYARMAHVVEGVYSAIYAVMRE